MASSSRVLLILIGAALVLAAAWLAETETQRSCRDWFCGPDGLSGQAVQLAETGDPEAIDFSKLALANDPASPARWCDLGDLLMDLRPPGYQREAEVCFRRAAELGGDNPIILQRIANHDFQIGDTDGALSNCYKILRKTHEFDSLIFSSYSRFGIAQPEVLTRGVPQEPEAVRSYLRFLLTRDDPIEATAAWKWAAAITPSPITDPLAQSYVSLLWRHREFASAVQSWAAYLAARAGDYLAPNHIFNGSFELEPSNETPLDWHRDAQAGVDMRRDYEIHQQGQVSMRVAFNGAQNLDFHGLGQTQPVPPGIYRLRASMKSQGLTTDQGVRLRAFDPEGGRFDVSTPALTGSTDWHTVELRLEVRPPTRLIRVELARQPSLKFDNKIKGTAWIDAVSLTLVN